MAVPVTTLCLVVGISKNLALTVDDHQEFQMIVYLVVTMFPIPSTTLHLNLLLSQSFQFIVKGCACCCFTFLTFSTDVIYLEIVSTLSGKLCLFSDCNLYVEVASPLGLVCRYNLRAFSFKSTAFLRWISRWLIDVAVKACVFFCLWWYLALCHLGA